VQVNKGNPKMYMELNDLHGIIKEMAIIEAQIKIARHDARETNIGHHKIDITHDRLYAAQNKYRTQCVQISNKQLCLWRARHRRCK